MSQEPTTPLAAVPGWKAEQAAKLAEHWITSAEQVVGIGATPQGVKTLAVELGVSVAEMQRLVAHAQKTLSPSVARQLTQPADTHSYGLGALPPENERRVAGTGRKKKR